MESTSIPTDTVVDDEAVARVAAIARRQGFELEGDALHAAATFDAWLAPHQLALREHELSFLNLVEPPTVFQWIERGGHSVGD